MAAIDKRGDTWRVRVRRRGFPIQTRTFPTKAMAERWARDVERDMDRGYFVDRSEAERNTLGDLLSRYLSEVTPTKRGADPEALRLKALIRRPICQYKLAALSSTDFADYRDQRLESVSPGTVNKELNLIAHAIETARREWGVYLPENPLRLVRRPTQPKARERRLMGDEEARLLAAADDARNPFLKPIILLAIETGMRLGELVQLEWRYADLEHRTFHLRDTKNGDARTVPLTFQAVAVLRELRTHDAQRVFPGLTTEAVKRAFMRARTRAEIEDLHFHDLRHEAASRFATILNPLELATVLGHKTLQMVKRYTHLQAVDLAKKLSMLAPVRFSADSD